MTQNHPATEELIRRMAAICLALGYPYTGMVDTETLGKVLLAAAGDSEPMQKAAVAAFSYALDPNGDDEDAARCKEVVEK